MSYCMMFKEEKENIQTWFHLYHGFDEVKPIQTNIYL